MSDTASIVECQPSVVALRAQFAERVRQVADECQRLNGWDDEQTVAECHAGAVHVAQRIADSLVSAAEMSLGLWQATR